MSRFFPVALVLEGATALVVGGGPDAAERAQALRAVGARVDLVAEEADAAVVRLAARGELRWWARAFHADDLSGVRVVVVTSRDAALLSEVRAAARRAGVWLCAVDRPERSDFVHVATAAVGPLTIGVSSHGAAPALAARTRDLISRALDARYARFADRIVAERSRLATATEVDRRARMAELFAGLDVEVTTRYPEWFRAEERA